MSTRSGEARPRKQAQIKIAKLLPKVGFVHIGASRLPDYPLSLGFGRVGTNVKLFERVI